MKSGYWHAKAVHYAGPVCGADDGPITRVTEDRHLVTCPDCPDLVWIEALPDDASAGDPRVIEVLREAQRGAFRKIDGVVVDATTAAAILTVYDALRPTSRAKLAALPVDRMAHVAWRLLRPHV
ncbi:hypothetical protein [Actinoplanes sp. NBRC 103695]|uniref:hypothetical protein n=1 Tax=Actinoplanes sp. NBRC 103695 TaxID=3032202 RepID=UPI0024A04F7F|nr:hypothetical protein [Actinoplanes sp. NBRC 103695]GLY98830.1 hypothetical protein Acsp02_60840 [Actinoplanes sp. NBRC 103695]